MAAYITMSTEPGCEFKVADIIAYADELKRRKVAKDKPVKIIGKIVEKVDVQLEMRTPVRAKRTIIAHKPHTPTKTPIRGARKARS